MLCRHAAARQHLPHRCQHADGHPHPEEARQFGAVGTRPVAPVWRDHVRPHASPDQRQQRRHQQRAAAGQPQRQVASRGQQAGQQAGCGQANGDDEGGGEVTAGRPQGAELHVPDAEPGAGQGDRRQQGRVGQRVQRTGQPRAHRQARHTGQQRHRQRGRQAHQHGQPQPAHLQRVVAGRRGQHHQALGQAGADHTGHQFAERLQLRPLRQRHRAQTHGEQLVEGGDAGQPGQCDGERPGNGAAGADGVGAHVRHVTLPR